MNAVHLVLLEGIELFSEDLRGADLQQVDFQRSILSSCNFNGVNLRGSFFMHSDLSKSKFIKADMRQSNFGGTVLSYCELKNTDLSGSNFSGADFFNANLEKAILRNANLFMTTICNANLKEANLQSSNLTISTFQGSDLTNSNFSLTTMVKTNFCDANISGSSIYGCSVWDIKVDDRTVQNNLSISEKDEYILTVDDLEIAQFINLLLGYKKLRQVFNCITERGVLLLGRFGKGGLEILRSLAEELRKKNYLPIIFDFDRPTDRNFTETIKTLAGLSRFVIFDLSGPSVPHELNAIVPHYKIPFVPILEVGNQPYSTYKDISEYPWVISPIVEYEDIDSLLEVLEDKIITPAEERHAERKKLMEKLF
jgi:uncharacterized protein YjbI with pentapeptide repeats